MPGVPGLFNAQQTAGWKRVVDAVHEKGGYIYAQLWHAGRATIPQMSGSPAVSASATVWDSPTECYSHPPVGATEQVPYSAHPPIELTVEHIKRTIEDYCQAAKAAMEAGFDGIELHGGNGYLPEQFLSSNINKRTDEYGGSPEKRCRFVLELMDQLAKTVGEENLAIRLSPFGLFNQTRSEQRLETWSHLSKELKRTHPNLSYVSFIEPVCLPIPCPTPELRLTTPALRANLQLRRKGRLPRQLGPHKRRPEQLPRDLWIYPLLLRRRLEPGELMGGPRVRPVRRSAVWTVLHQQPGPS